MSTLDDAIQAIRMGDQEQGRAILEDILEEDEENEEVWLWLSSVVDTDEDREICLENVLALNPDNVVAQRGLEALRAGTFNVHTIVGDALEERGEEPPTESSFIEEFELADDFEDEDLVMPSTMAGTAPAKGKKSGGLNLRLVILIALIFLVGILAVGGLAASFLFGGDNGGGPTDQPTQGAPAGGGEQQEAATDTPTPIPTETPTLTPTATVFELPTPEPTPEPTPTATPVVAPTPQ